MCWWKSTATTTVARAAILLCTVTPKLGQFAGLPTFGSLHSYYSSDLIVTPLEKSFVGKEERRRWAESCSLLAKWNRNESAVFVHLFFVWGSWQTFAKRCFANISIACLWPQCKSPRTICLCRWVKNGTEDLTLAHSKCILEPLKTLAKIGLPIRIHYNYERNTNLFCKYLGIYLLALACTSYLRSRSITAGCQDLLADYTTFFPVVIYVCILWCASAHIVSGHKQKAGKVCQRRGPQAQCQIPHSMKR